MGSEIALIAIARPTCSINVFRKWFIVLLLLCVKTSWHASPDSPWLPNTLRISEQLPVQQGKNPYAIMLSKQVFINVQLQKPKNGRVQAMQAMRLCFKGYFGSKALDHALCFQDSNRKICGAH
jgi:hypothetical protein